MAKAARTPQYVKALESYQQVSTVAQEASVASRDVQPVVDEATAAAAAEVLTQVSKAIKLCDKERLVATEPYRQSTDVINAEFKELASPLKGVEQRLDEEIINFNAKKRLEQQEAQREHERQVREHEEAVRKQEEDRKRQEAEAAKRAEEQRQAEAAAAAAQQEPPPPPPEPEPTPPPAPPPPPPPPPPPSDGVRQTTGGSVAPRTVWLFEVFDPSSVPVEFRVVEEKLIRAAVKDGARNIAGVRIYPEERLTKR